jgi:beta-aspartyl-peptidase (threonine type)
LAAATSTGGLFLKLPGRVGDSPLPGAGTYAGSAAAVSATGKGELVMRVLGAKRIHDLIGSGARAQPAIQQMLREMRANVGADAGFIAVSRAGDIGIAHGTPAMVHAWCRDGEPGIQAGWKV